MKCWDAMRPHTHTNRHREGVRSGSEVASSGKERKIKVEMRLSELRTEKISLKMLQAHSSAQEEEKGPFAIFRAVDVIKIKS